MHYGTHILSHSQPKQFKAMQLFDGTKCISFMDSTYLEEDGCKLFESLKYFTSYTIIHINILNNRTIALFLNDIQHYKSIKKLIIKYKYINELSNTFALSVLSLNHLKTLEISHSEVDDSFMSSISQRLAYNHSLAELSLSHNHVTGKGFNYVIIALKFNHILESVDFEGNNICDDGLANIEKMLTTNRSLLKIYLSSNGITEYGLDEIGRGLMHNHSLVQLHIGALVIR